MKPGRRAGLESLIASLASAPTGIRDAAARSLEQAERTLIRLRAEARAAAVVGDGKAALRIARDLAVLARQIADAAQDYAVAQTEPDFVSPALAKATARIHAASGGPEVALDASALVSAAAAAAAEAALSAGALAPGEPAAAMIDRPIQPAERDSALGSPPPGGAGGPQDESIPVTALRLFEETMALLCTMEELIRGSRTGAPKRPA